MIRKRMAVAVAVVGLGLGTLGVGGVRAQGNGVGPSEGTTGEARACQAHAENAGESVAHGLECAPSATLVITCEPGVTTQVIGSGLLPGSVVEIVIPSSGDRIAIGIVDESGNFFTTIAYFVVGDTVEATTAPGGLITATVPPECPTR